LSVYLGKSKIVADAEAKAQTADGKARELVARRKAGLFFDRCDRIEMSLAIFRDDVPFASKEMVSK
jgi:hypothetical protein